MKREDEITTNNLLVTCSDVSSDACKTERKKAYDDIDAAANFEGYRLQKVVISSENIASKEIRLAIPAKTNKVQWEQITKAIDYGKSQGVKVIVTGVK